LNENRGNFINFEEKRGKFIIFGGNRGLYAICIIDLGGMDAPDHGQSGGKAKKQKRTKIGGIYKFLLNYGAYAVYIIGLWDGHPCP